MSSLRARTREAPATASDRFDEELRALSRLQSAARSALSRITWQVACQKRTSRIAALVRVLPTLITPTVVSTKESAGWYFSFDKVVVAFIALPPAHTVDELLAPITVHIYRPALVDLIGLSELQHKGTASVVLTDHD